MVITFILYPLFDYISITEPCARFLLSLIQDLSIDFPSHFILSLIDVYKDTATRDKLIFPSTITWILHYASVSYLESPHFSVMCAIIAATVRQSEAQLRPKRPRIKMATPPASSAPSTFAPFSSEGGVTFESVMAQFQHMDAHLGTLTSEMYHVNTYVSRIVRRQAHLGGFVEPPSPSPEASEDEDDDGDSDGDANENKDASSSGDDEMIASQ